MASALINVPSRAKRGEIIEIKTLISHTMETGFRRTQLGAVIPRERHALFPRARPQKNACHCRKKSVVFCALFWGTPLFFRAPARNCVNWNGTYSQTKL